MSLANIHDELHLKLLTDNNSLLVLEYAKILFKTRFGYIYSGRSTSPPNAASPANLSAEKRVLNFQDVSQDNVTEFMNEILKAQKVPDWMHGRFLFLCPQSALKQLKNGLDEAQDDLLKWTAGLVDFTPNNEWHYRSLRKTYSPSDPSQQNSVETNAILVFVNASLSKDNITVKETLVIISILANHVFDSPALKVYYEVILSLAFVEQQLRTAAYNDASSIMLNNSKPITDDTSLTQALVPFTETLFNGHFHYNWGQTPSDYLDNGSYLKINADALGYFDAGKTDGVDSFVKDTLLKGITIPDWTSDSAISDIVGTFTEIVTNDSDTRSWIPINLDKKYDDHTGVHNSLRVSAVAVYYTYSQRLYDGRVAKIAYIFWMGMIYEKPPLQTVVYNDMIKQLYDNLHNSMSAVSTDGLTSDKAGLITLLSRCASSKFNTFGYEFKGSSTKPRDSNGGEVYGVECFGEFNDVTGPNISKWATDEIFKDHTFSFFSTVPLLQSQLNQQIISWLTKNTDITSGNNWDIQTFSKSYSDPSDSSKLLKTSAVAFFANGSLTESGFISKSNFFYYMGVYYVADDSSDSDSGDV
ncbi:hypothetical protein BDQ12DRAFT_768569 [Crucibulum laeve]|uniref:Uncharacterized protein n=1 Tax=Crucibulum laeve TaxID=68775 RepID=A0A5C3LKY6_9AGAR|nr:hypothetical protein BDQ12DRAFT_768569 [Crucibulum laeve]